MAVVDVLLASATENSCQRDQLSIADIFLLLPTALVCVRLGSSSTLRPLQFGLLLSGRMDLRSYSEARTKQALIMP